MALIFKYCTKVALIKFMYHAAKYGKEADKSSSGCLISKHELPVTSNEWQSP